jgi:glycosyltransferase involved in cell wall biosynthesis
MPKNRIYTGLYGAYEGIYKEITPIENRPLEFLFIGQLIQRKSVDILVKAFQEYKNEGGNWNLRLVGSGPLASLCEGNGISVENFAQPFEVVRKMNQARVLILPSKDDNWGTVVCEAAACGMLLLTSKNVGATYDIVSEGVNGLILPSISTKEIKKALFAFERMDEEAFKKGSTVSKEIAGRFTSREYFAAITTIIRELFI